MKKNTLLTPSKARLMQFSQDKTKKYNWLFLPGGPGLGSESLTDLMSILSLPGTMWYLDLPGDGSNHTTDDAESFSQWYYGLIEASKAVEKPILVAHSSGGMLALSTPELENNLSGLVLMDSAPNAGWIDLFIKYVKKHPIDDVARLQKNYEENPSNHLLRKLTLACVPYLSTPNSSKQLKKMLATLPYNHKSHFWGTTHFDKYYQARWVPDDIPTLIFSGSNDYVTPLNLFLDAKEFQKPNICIREIKNAAHFPWFDNPDQVKQVFTEYCNKLDARLI